MKILKGHVEALGPDGTDLLVTVLADGSAQIVWRAGRDELRARWSDPVALVPQYLGMPEGAR